MKKLILGILLAIGSTGFAETAKPAAAYGFLSNWSAAKPSVVKINGDVITSQMSERFIRVNGGTVPIAIMTTGEIQAKTKKGIPTDFEGTIAKLMGIKHWKKEFRGNYTAYEAEVPTAARYVKVFVSKNTKVYRYSIVSIRTAFMLPTYYEAEILQREQMSDSKGVAELQRPGSAFAQIYHFLLASPAQASSTSLSDLLSMLTSDSSTVSSAVSSAASRAGTLVTNATGSVNGLTTAVNTGATNLTRTISSTGNSIISTANGLGGVLTSNVTNVTSTASSVAASVHGDVSTINNAVNKVMNPVDDFKAALGAGLGYSLGTMLVQFAADGGAAICKQIFYAITGNLPDDVQNNLKAEGKKAWDDLESLSKKALELDKQMQLTMLSMQALTGQSPVTSVDLRRKQYALQGDVDKLKDAVKYLPDGKIRDLCSDALDKANTQLMIVQNMAPILSSSNVTSPKDLCGSFDQLYQQWANLELQIANARNILLNNMSYMLTGAAKEAAKASKSPTSHYQDNTNCGKLDDTTAAALDDLDDKISQNKCYSQNQSALCYKLFAAKEEEKSNAAATQASCQDMVNLKQAQDKTDDDLRRSRMVRQASQMMDSSYKKLVSSYCEAGSTDPGCNGDQGSFAAIHDSMQKRFDYVAKTCPGSITQADPSAAQAGQQMAAALDHGDVPLASMKASQLPNSDQGPGFLGRMAQNISSFFKSIF